MHPKHLRPPPLKCLLVIDGRCPWIGFILTGVATGVLLAFHDYVDLSLSLTFVFVVFSVYIGGLWWGLAAAGLVIGAEVWLLFPLAEYGRFAVVSLTLLATVYLVAILQRKAVIGESINGNITSLLQIMASLQDTLEDYDRYTRDEIRDRLRAATDGVVNLTTRVKGWHDIRREMEEAERAVYGGGGRRKDE